MAATTRWVEYSKDSAASSYLGITTSGVGTRGVAKALSATNAKFTIGPANNTLNIDLNGVTYDQITLTSGVDLDARFVARDITEKMHAERGDVADIWKHASCEWVNNQLHIYSGDIGTDSSVTVASGSLSTAYATLGFSSKQEDGGGVHSYNSNLYNGGISLSGTVNEAWEGMFDEIYTIIINKTAASIGTPNHTGTYQGTMTPGGQYNYGTSTTYTITSSGGGTVGGGVGNVPTFSWTETGSVDIGGPVDILYADHWYNVGVRGLKVKWTDKVFGDGDTWTIVCSHPEHSSGSDNQSLPGVAQYVWTSNRGDECTSAHTTSNTSYTRVGTRGVSIKFVGGTNNLRAGDEFRVVCTPPQPSLYGISSLNYGNVTVTTESTVKSVLFEIMGGAVMMTAVRFGLQSHGSFSYHGGGGDTFFRWGTVGAGDDAGAPPVDGKEWRTGVTDADLSGTIPAYLAATDADLLEVSTADDSKNLENYQGGLVSDFVYLCIRLGADETGSNSSINYRLYFDYS